MPRGVWQWQCVLGGVCRLPGYWWTCAAAPAEACDVATAQKHRCGDSPDTYAAELRRTADAKATGRAARNSQERECASAGNRARVTSMATMYSTTRPLMLVVTKLRKSVCTNQAHLMVG